MSLRILVEGPGYLALDKPPGVSVIPGRGETSPASLREQLETSLGRKLFVVHRLDRDTSGVLLFALDARTHRTLSMAFEAGKIKKRYWALVAGRLEAPLRIEVALAPARRGRMRPTHPGEEGQAAVTEVAPVEAWERASWIEAVPLTGRTHQIRVHLRSAGHPLLFDHQYGRKEPFSAAELGGTGTERVLSRTPLHARQLVLPALEGLEPAVIEAPMPGDMEVALRLLRGGRG